MNKKNKQIKTHRHRQQYGGCQRESGKGESRKRSQIYDDRKEFDFGW